MTGICRHAEAAEGPATAAVAAAAKLLIKKRRNMSSTKQIPGEISAASTNDAAAAAAAASVADLKEAPHKGTKEKTATRKNIPRRKLRRSIVTLSEDEAIKAAIAACLEESLTESEKEEEEEGGKKRMPVTTSGAVHGDALIKDAKEKMEALDDPVQPHDAWTDVLKKMRKAGWDTRVPAPLVGGLPIGGANFVFLLPSGKRPKQGGEGGLDYLLNKDAAKKFAKENFGWSGLSSTPHENASEKFGRTPKRNKNLKVRIDTNAPSQRMGDSKGGTRKGTKDTAKRKSNPSHDDRPGTKSKRKKTKKEKSLRKCIPVEDLTLEETQRLLEEAAELVKLKQKERDDDIVTARSLPFEVLESIYNEEKVKQSTIDLATNDSGPIEPDGSGEALRNMEKERNDLSASLASVKKERDDYCEKLGNAEEDIEDTNELVQQQALATDRYQGRIDELGEHALAAGVDPKIINEIRFRPLSSGR